MWDDAEVPFGKGNGKAAPHLLRCTAEHLQARSDGGKDTFDNIVAACWFCNTRRHNQKVPLEPEAYRQHVRRRMSAGRWLAGKFANRR
ncbi:HNH endonuclease signature motif containing protein [Roseivivax marinus]